jgi:hypothetical protein
MFFFALCVPISLYEPTSFFLKFIWIAYYKVSRLQIFFIANEELGKGKGKNENRN